MSQPLHIINLCASHYIPKLRDIMVPGVLVVVFVIGPKCPAYMKSTMDTASPAFKPPVL